MTASTLRLSGLILALSAFGTHAIAAEGAYRRTCRINGGQAWDIQISGDQLSLCRFGGLGFSVDTYYSAKVDRLVPDAVAAFRSGPTSCERAGGSETSASDLENNAVSICRFEDSSIVESAALEQGPVGAPALARALR